VCTARRRESLQIQTVRASALLAAEDDRDHPEGLVATHRGGVAAQLQPQILARVRVQRSVVGNDELASIVGLELERRVVHGVLVHLADGEAVRTDMPHGGRSYRTSDDTGVRLGDVLHRGRALELRGTVDRNSDLGRRRRIRRRAEHQAPDRDHEGPQQQHDHDLEDHVSCAPTSGGLGV